MTIQNGRTTIPEDFKDLLESMALAQNHRPGDERVVVFVRPEHTTQKDG